MIFSLAETLIDSAASAQKPKIVIEAGSSFGWHKYLNSNQAKLVLEDLNFVMKDELVG